MPRLLTHTYKTHTHIARDGKKLELSWKNNFNFHLIIFCGRQCAAASSSGGGGGGGDVIVAILLGCCRRHVTVFTADCLFSVRALCNLQTLRRTLRNLSRVPFVVTCGYFTVFSLWRLGRWFCWCFECVVVFGFSGGGILFANLTFCLESSNFSNTNFQIILYTNSILH